MFNLILSKEPCMNSKDDDIQKLTHQIEALNMQIESLAVMKNQAELSAKKYGQDIEQMRAKHLALTQELHGLESADSSNMWENIGDGG